MDSLFLGILESIDQQVNEVKYLLTIDNQLNNTNITVDDIKDIIKYVMDDNFELKFNENVLFITDGDIVMTCKALKNAFINKEYDYILFINEGFIGINQWLVSTFNKIVPDISFILDTDSNYNKYIKREDFIVVPLGEKALVEQVKEDFNN